MMSISADCFFIFTLCLHAFRSRCYVRWHHWCLFRLTVFFIFTLCLHAFRSRCYVRWHQWCLFRLTVFLFLSYAFMPSVLGVSQMAWLLEWLEAIKGVRNSKLFSCIIAYHCLPFFVVCHFLPYGVACSSALSIALFYISSFRFDGRWFKSELTTMPQCRVLAESITVSISY